MTAWQDYVPERTQGDPTIAELAERYLIEQERRGVRDLRRYQDVIRLHIVPELGGLRVRAFGVDEATGWIRWLRAESGLANKTINLIVGFARGVLDLAVPGVVALNPLRCLPRGTLPSKRRAINPEAEVMTPEQVNRLFACGRVTPFRRAMWTTALMSGARSGELSALAWKDIDREPDLPALCIERSYDGHRDSTGETKTGTTRRVPIHPELGRVLEHHRTAVWPTLFGREPCLEDLLFPIERSGELHPHRNSILRRWWQEDLDAAEISDRRLHATRHNFVTLLRRAGAPVDAIRPLTHARDSDRDVFGSYSHLDWKAHCDAVRLFPVDPIALPEARAVVSLREAARRLRTSADTVVRWIKSGRLRADRPGFDWQIDAESVDALAPRDEELLVEQVAERLGRTPQHVTRMLRAGRLKGRQIERRWYIDGTSL